MNDGGTEFDTRVAGLAEPLRGFLRKRVPDDATAADLAQETLLKVYRSRAALREGERLEAWLYRIARRTLADYYRRRRPTEPLPDSLTGRAAEAEFAEADRVWLTRSLHAFLENLPDSYREPVRLAELEGLPLAVVARRLGLSLTATKSRVRRGRELLKTRLQQCCRFELDRYGTVIGCEPRGGRGAETRCDCG